MTNYACVFLVNAREISGKILQSNDRYIEGIAVTYESCCFIRRIAVEYTGKNEGLVCYKPYCFTVNASESDNYVSCEFLHHFDKLAFVHQRMYYIAYIIRNRRVDRNDIRYFMFFYPV